ncbi:uncharacterized protein [Eleutherodactylus coqui]|uniref:uncharacterized protein n=1 Tax=Eleutherodactylus coqui TaxID=57060 RepID=UPI003462D37C
MKRARRTHTEESDSEEGLLEDSPSESTPPMEDVKKYFFSSADLGQLLNAVRRTMQVEEEVPQQPSFQDSLFRGLQPQPKPSFPGRNLQLPSPPPTSNRLSGGCLYGVGEARSTFGSPLTRPGEPSGSRPGQRISHQRTGSVPYPSKDIESLGLPWIPSWRKHRIKVKGYPRRSPSSGLPPPTLHPLFPLGHTREKGKLDVGPTPKVERGSTRNPRLQDLAAKVLEWIEQRTPSVTAFHVRGPENSMADHLSRRKIDPGECTLHPHVFQLIVERWGTPQVDLFASRENTVSPFFFQGSGRGLPGSRRAVPGLGLGPRIRLPTHPSGPKENSGVPRLRYPGAPFWPKRPWFPLLGALSTQDPLHLPQRDNLLQQGPLICTEVRKFRLTAWKLSG